MVHLWNCEWLTAASSIERLLLMPCMATDGFFGPACQAAAAVSE